MARKRGQNEGSIFKRSDGRWAASIDLGWRNGKRHRKCFYAVTRAEVQQQLTAALRANQLGLLVAPERQTVRQFFDRWLVESAKPTLRPLTFQRYGQLLRIHILPALGRIPLAKLGPHHVQQFMNDKLKAGLSPRTVEFCHAVIRSALKQAERWGLVPRNVATLVDAPRVRRSEVEPLTPDDARQFLEVVANDRSGALYTVALACGLRRGEALGLRWEDVDLESGALTVRHALQRINGKLQLVEPKTARSRRTIPLPDVAIAAIRRHRVGQLEERLLAGSRWRDTGFVFTTRIGTPFDERSVSRRFHLALARAGLAPQRFHDLRHTCASLLLAQGVHARLVMETLGHSQIGLTMNTYSHVMPSLLREAASKMDGILSGKK